MGVKLFCYSLWQLWYIKDVPFVNTFLFYPVRMRVVCIECPWNWSPRRADNGCGSPDRAHRWLPKPLLACSLVDGMALIVRDRYPVNVQIIDGRRKSLPALRGVSVIGRYPGAYAARLISGRPFGPQVATH